MQRPYTFAVADPDFYAPLESAPRDGELRPGEVPDGWSARDQGQWRMWSRPDTRLPDEGWKVHVSARPDRLARVLDDAAAVCFEQGVAFKHLVTPLVYAWLHHKHAARAQSGKFIAAYPPDAAASRRLMERLSAVLDGEEGPFILSDRRFTDRAPVYYRYGAYRRLIRTLPDGTDQRLVHDGYGELVEDRRDVAFRLPAGITDPFAATRPERPATAGPTVFHGFSFDAVLRHSNSGGAYRGTEVATGRPVFIKEARPWTGMGAGRDAVARLRGEWATLRALHAAAPGLAPEPVTCFRQWEHHFLVTEFIEGGDSFHSWVVGNSPVIRPQTDATELIGYYRRVERLLDAIGDVIGRLHELGYVFVDLSTGNVLVDQEDRIRLIDFEAAVRIGEDFVPITTPGFAPPPELVADDPRIYDRYGLAALAMSALMPLQLVVRHESRLLPHLRRHLEDRGPLPAGLWERAVRYAPAPAVDAAPLPAPEQLDEDLPGRLAELRDRTADALLAMADPAHPERVFPTVPEGYTTNTHCVAYGTAGVIHALTRAGRPLPEGLLARLRKDALAGLDTLPPGLHTGLAGIAWVLADQGLLEEARVLLAAADRHPLTVSDATLGGGTAGVAMAHLALYGHTGEEHHLGRARALADGLPAAAEITAHIGRDEATGLLHGRCGIALMLQQLAQVTGEDRPLAAGLRLLHDELDLDPDPSSATLTFQVSRTDRRRLPYLFAGSAGMTHTVVRYLPMTGDERLHAAVPRMLPRLRTRFTVMSGLYQGLAGLGLSLAEYGRLAGDAHAREQALHTARGLFHFAVGHPTGVRFLGDQLLRFSAELWSGSAGVLLFLSQLLEPAPDPFFTVDAVR